MSDTAPQNIVAIILARGGSKRIPKKNIVDVAGKPMIAWTIEAALGSKYVSRVLVSTEDEEIAAISKEYGAEVPFLRDRYADDYSPASPATIRAIEQLEELEGESPCTVVQLMANCPLRNAEDIDTALETFDESEGNFQISCFDRILGNPWVAHTIDDQRVASPVLYDEMKNPKRTQDQPSLYCPSGAIWIAKTAELLKAGTFYGPNYTFCPIHWKKAFDVDDNDDLEMVKFFLRS